MMTGHSNEFVTLTPIQKPTSKTVVFSDSDSQQESDFPIAQILLEIDQTSPVTFSEYRTITLEAVLAYVGGI